jgi:hypothetical protein
MQKKYPQGAVEWAVPSFPGARTVLATILVISLQVNLLFAIFAVYFAASNTSRWPDLMGPMPQHNMEKLNNLIHIHETAVSWPSGLGKH